MSNDALADVLDLAIAGVRELHPYVGPPPVDQISLESGQPLTRLASNESPLGPGPLVREALNRFEDLSRYPDGGAVQLRQALAKHSSLQVEQIIMGNGSNEILELVARVFLTPGRKSVFFEHCFAVYPLVTQATGAHGVAVPVQQDYQQNLEAMASAVDETTAVVWLANPNNPTGSAHSHSDVLAFLRSLPRKLVVVLDQAYCDFSTLTDALSPGNLQEIMAAHPGVVVTRTFSKAHGLASLRVGYGMAAEKLVELLNRARQPFNVNALAQLAALAALQDSAHLQRTQDLVLEQRPLVAEALRALACDVLPSDGNFLAFSSLSVSGSEIAAELIKRGVLVRSLASYDMPEYLRVTIGTAKENQRFLQALGDVLKKAA